VVVWLASAAVAAQLQVDLDTPRVGVGETVGLRVTVIGAVPTAVPQIEAPDGLEVKFDHRSQQTQIINGQVTRWTTYNYRLTGVRQGDFTLGPFSAEVGLDHLSAPARSVLVGPPPPPATQGPILASQTASSVDLWEGQVVIWEYRVSSRDEWLRSPAWEAARTPSLAPVKQGAEEHHQYNVAAASGDTHVDEFHVAYRAVAAGEVEVGPALIRIDIPEKGHRSPFGLPGFDPFAPYRSEVVSTAPVGLHIRSLPSPPPSFTGLVGDFEVTQELSSQHMGIDGTADWKVQITGDGTLESFAFPKGAAPDGVRFYEQSPTTQARLDDGRYVAQGRFSRQIVAIRPGVIDLPPTTLTWFSPTRGEYVSQTIDPPPIEVTGAVADVAVKSFSDKTPVEAEEIDGVRPAVVSGAAQRWSWMGWIPFASIPALVALFGLLVEAAVAWWRARPRAQAVVAPPTPLQRLQRLPQAPGDRLAALDHALREAVGRRVGRASSAESVGAGRDHAAAVRELLRELDRARYAGGEPPADLERRIVVAVTQLEGR
jgi:hypothetical protein